MIQIGPYIVEVSEGGFKLNVANVPVNKAYSFAKKRIPNLDELIPDFGRNYHNLQQATRKALNIPRVDMPVIEPRDMDRFKKDLESGNLDILKPYAYDYLYAPKDLNLRSGEEWIKLGRKDGKISDDKIRAKWTSVSAKKLLPTQSQIWLEKLVDNIAKFGVPTQGSPITQATLIVSKEGYILDGHHRYGQAMLADPSLRMKALYIPLDIKKLLQVGRSYGNAIGNQQKA